MNRRSVLRLTGVGTAGTLGGCLGRLSSRTDDSSGGSDLDGPHRFAIEPT